MKTLIVVDMQNDFIDGALANSAAAAIVEPMAEYIKNFEGDVIFTRDTHYSGYLNTQEGRNLPIVHCICDTEGWEIHDSGDPFEWGDKLIAHYEKLGINPKTKTLLFSDGLDFDKAQEIYDYFKDRINVSFDIGTYLTNDTAVPALNIVIKLQYVNGHPVAKLSDNPGKTMCQDENYINYLYNAVEYRLKEGI